MWRGDRQARPEEAMGGTREGQEQSGTPAAARALKLGLLTWVPHTQGLLESLGPRVWASSLTVLEFVPASLCF